MHQSESEVAQWCPILRNPVDCSPSGSSVHGIFRQEYWSGVTLPSPSDQIICSNNVLQHKVPGLLDEMADSTTGTGNIYDEPEGS